jgi:hypothetical protein
VRRGDELWLYYVGFQLGVHVRYLLFSGLAISHDGGESFQRYSRVPVMDRCEGETLVRTAPFVLPEAEGFRMWYLGGDSFELIGDKLLPRYSLRHLWSPDGIVWGPAGKVLIEPGCDEHGFGRPQVVRDPEGYRMWYSSRRRGLGYRPGYADSNRWPTTISAMTP